MLVVLLTVTGGLATVGAAVLARHRAQAAADLAALSAATDLAAGAATACDQAGVVARAMHAGLADCTVDGLDVVVTTTVTPRVGNWTLGPARAAARAGPAPENPPRV